MTQIRKERRRYERYDMETKIYFRVSYDVKTKIKFQVLNKKKDKLLPERFSGLSKNVSVDGMRFASKKRLSKGDNLYIEVYLPKQKSPICMTGEVIWSKMLSPHSKGDYQFDTGVRLITVSNNSVLKSVYYDNKNHIIWSTVLDSVFGSFQKFIKRKR